MFGKKSERELGSNKEFEVHADGSISYFTSDVTDELRKAAEAEREKQISDREQAAYADQREVGTPEALEEDK